ncbi:MAG: HlyD family efflux transporter periplasmic adaptor subunit [Dongiaceae bacterium]
MTGDRESDPGGRAAAWPARAGACRAGTVHRRFAALLAVALLCGAPLPRALADSPPPAAAEPTPPPTTLHGAVAAFAWSVVDKLRSMAAATGEALYETAYMFGTNRVPVPRGSVADPVSDLNPAADPFPSLAAPPAKVAAATTPGPATKPVELAAATIDANRPAAPAPPPARPAAAAPAAPPPAADDRIEPGLLENFVYDQAEQRSDGSFFVPKPLQRLFQIRTEVATSTAMPMTVRLPGRIIPDPHAHGQVMASLLGRIVPPPGGLPVVGEVVKAGEVLAYVEPAVGVVDRTEVRRKVAELTTAIRVETENLEILKQFWFVPFRDGKVYQAEQRLAGLRREREALLPLLQTQEPLRAPTDGVISDSTAVSGSIVHPGDRIFEIVNPKLLWIEASAPDPATADNASRVLTASALTPEGERLTLTFVGTSLAVRQQSTPVLFRIEDPPPGLRVGRPVTVSPSTARTRRSAASRCGGRRSPSAPTASSSSGSRRRPRIFYRAGTRRGPRRADSAGDRRHLRGAHIVTHGVSFLAWPTADRGAWDAGRPGRARPGGAAARARTGAGRTRPAGAGSLREAGGALRPRTPWSSAGSASCSSRPTASCWPSLTGWPTTRR